MAGCKTDFLCTLLQYRVFKSVFRLSVRLHEGPSIFNFALILFLIWDSWIFFARCVPGLTIIILFVTKSLHVSNYSKCKHSAVSVLCFYNGLEVKTPQVLLSGSCLSTVWNTTLMSLCLQTQVPVNPEGVFQPSFRWVLKMYVLSSKSLILI